MFDKYFSGGTGLSGLEKIDALNLLSRHCRLKWKRGEGENAQQKINLLSIAAETYSLGSRSSNTVITKWIIEKERKNRLSPICNIHLSQLLSLLGETINCYGKKEKRILASKYSLVHFSFGFFL